MNFIHSVDKAFRVIKIMDLIGLYQKATELYFLTPFLANQMELFHTQYYAYIHPRLDSQIEPKIFDWSQRLLLPLRCMLQVYFFFLRETITKLLRIT